MQQAVDVGHKPWDARSRLEGAVCPLLFSSSSSGIVRCDAQGVVIIFLGRPTIIRFCANSSRIYPTNLL